MKNEQGKGRNKISLRDLSRLLSEDIRVYSGSGKIHLRLLARHMCFNASLQLIVMYRWSHFIYTRGRVGAVISWALEWLEMVLFGCLIACEAEIGRRFRIAHPTGIVIGLAKIGDNVTIWQNVTIGASGIVGENKEWPTIENNVKIFANAVIVGGITVGEGSTIGALTFINRDVPQDSVALTEKTLSKPTE